MVVGFTTTCEICTVTTKVVTSKLVHGELYLIELYVIKLAVPCDRSVVFSTNKTDRHDKTDILLKMALKIINHIKPQLAIKSVHFDFIRDIIYYYFIFDFNKQN